LYFAIELHTLICCDITFWRIIARFTEKSGKWAP